MSQLRILLEYFTEVPWFKRQRNSIEFLSRIIDYCERLPPDDNGFYLRVIEDTSKLYDAIVFGLNHGKFIYSSEIFSVRGTSSLPKIFNGLLLSIFDKKGNLRDDYSAQSVQTLLEGLSMIKRMRIEGSEEKARAKAVCKFSESQRRERLFIPEVADALSVYWGILEQRIIDRNLFTLGSCGAGVTLDMAFPWVPRLQLPLLDSMPNRPAKVFLEQCLNNKLGVNYSDLPRSHVDGSYLIRFYHWKPYRQVRLVTVPKSALIDRPITVTDTFSTILGASVRLSCMAAASTLGLMKMVNVFEQRKSQELLKKHYNEVFAFDAEDGSTCVTRKVNKHLLKRAPLLYDATLAAEPHSFKDDLDKSVSLDIPGPDGQTGREITTLTMGDAFTVAELSFTMLFSAIYGQWCQDTDVIVGTIPSVDEAFDSIKNAIELGLIAVVGDDLIYSRHAHNKTIAVLQAIGIQRNERKSSYPLANHQESCGAWFVRDPKGGIVQIAPYRLYTDDPDVTIEQMSVSEYLRRLHDVGSPNCVAAGIAIARVFPKFAQLIKYESYNSDELGSCIGFKIRRHCFRRRNDRRTRVDDTISYLFGFESRGVSPRQTKRPLRIRYRKERITENSGVGPFRDNCRRPSFDPAICDDCTEIPLTYKDALRLDNMVHCWATQFKKKTALVANYIDSGFYHPSVAEGWAEYESQSNEGYACITQRRALTSSN